MDKDRLIIRIENLKGYAEYGNPILVFVDWINEYTKDVVYCACTGHGEGEYDALIQQTRPITDKELASFNGIIYGYNLNDFRIVKKRIYK